MKKKHDETKTISSQMAQTLLKDLSDAGSSIKFSGNIQGNSMLPWIKACDRIKIIPVTSPLRVGDIVAFYDGLKSRLIAHRVISTHGNHIVTKGDNCLKPDPSILKKDVSGKVIEIFRDSKPVKFGLGIERYVIALLSRLNILPITTWAIQKLKKLA